MASQSSKNKQPNPVALDCPSCGAALPAGEGRVSCSYCGSLVQITKPKPTQHVPKPGEPGGGVVWSSPTVTIIQARRRQGGQQSRTAGCIGVSIIVGSILATIVFVLAVTGAFTAILPATLINNTPLQPRLFGSQRVVALSADQSLPQLIAFVNGGEGNKRRLALLDMATNKRLWVGPALSDETYASAPIAFGGDVIVYPDQRTLKGFSRSDGSQLWATDLTDKVCSGCLVVVGTTAIALADDYVVQGVDLASGERLWTSDVIGDYGLRELRIVDGKVLVYGRNADVDGQVSVLDPITGEVLQQFTPECKLDAFDENETVYTDPDGTQFLSADGKTLVMFADSFKPCFLAYDPTTGTKLWQQSFDYPENGISIDKRIIVGSQSYFVGGRERVYAVGRKDGAVRELFNESDYAFHTLAERDGVLLTLAIKQRGTRIIELWGLDSESGKRLWRREFNGDGEMLREPYDAAGTVGENEEIWDLLETATGIVLIRLEANPHQYVIEQLDLKTGQPTSSQMIERPPDDTVWVPDFVLQQGNLLVLNESTVLVGIDLVNGKQVYEGP
jgi:outer membrane protein assembly factor BamB